jgi:hypothetical protein
LSQQERAELRTIAADMTRLEPQGRTDGVEYVPQALNNAEYEAQFAAGLVRKGSLGFATESDMNQDWEGAYFSIYHPAELNPQLRLFANQLNSKVSLVRPTTQRNLSKPMFLTPGIERDPMGARVNNQLNQITSQQASLSQQIAWMRQQLAREKNGAEQDRLRDAILGLEAQSASLDMSRKQLYGTDQAYLPDVSRSDLPLQVAAAPADAGPPPADAVDPPPPPTDPPLVLTPWSNRTDAEPRNKYLDAFNSRLLGVSQAAELSAGQSLLNASTAWTGPGDVKDHMGQYRGGTDNAGGGSGGGTSEGEALRPVIPPPPVADGGPLANTISGILRPSMSDRLGEAIRTFDPKRLTTRTPLGLTAPFSSVPGALPPDRPSNAQYNTAMLEEARQTQGSMDLTRHVSQGLGSDHNLLTQPRLLPESSPSRWSAYDLQTEANFRDFSQGHNGVPLAAGENDRLPAFNDGKNPFPLNFPSHLEKKTPKAFASTSKPKTKTSQWNTEDVKRLIVDAPTQIVERLNQLRSYARNSSNYKISTGLLMSMKSIASDVVRIWMAGAVVAASTQRLLAQDPTIQSMLVQKGVDIQGLLASSGKPGKRKRSAKSSFAVGRGRKKGRR